MDKLSTIHLKLNGYIKQIGSKIDNPPPGPMTNAPMTNDQ
jgi:hypothetical protein